VQLIRRYWQREKLRQELGQRFLAQAKMRHQKFSESRISRVISGTALDELALSLSASDSSSFGNSSGLRFSDSGGGLYMSSNDVSAAASSRRSRTPSPFRGLSQTFV